MSRRSVDPKYGTRWFSIKPSVSLAYVGFIVDAHVAGVPSAELGVAGEGVDLVLGGCR